MSANNNDYLFKVVVVGDVSTGKTSIIKRYVHNIFSDNYKSTIGVDFALKILQINNDTIRIQLWDIAGQERFGNMTKVYYKEAVGGIIVFDINKYSSFDNIKHWKRDLDQKTMSYSDTGENTIPVILLANKIDIAKEDWEEQRKIMDDFCKEYGFIAWMETSAKDGRGIDDAAKKLVAAILKTSKPIEKKTEGIVDLSPPPEPKKECCL